MPEIWFTSDTHLGHNKDFVWTPRGFNSIEGMNEAIIERWNSVVKYNDIVYHLGDVMLGNNEEGLKLLSQLNGNIILALGNHDTDTRVQLFKTIKNIKDIQMGYRIKVGKKTFILSHYPQLVANGDDKKPIYSIHGHTHSQNKWSDIPHAYNVNMDAHNCTPVNLNTIIEDINKERNLLK
jgi:calcineurin-like phosphoesterase family protein